MRGPAAAYGAASFISLSRSSEIHSNKSDTQQLIDVAEYLLLEPLMAVLAATAVEPGAAFPVLVGADALSLAAVLMEAALAAVTHQEEAGLLVRAWGPLPETFPAATPL
jgi:hypothetical protein